MDAIKVVGANTKAYKRLQAAATLINAEIEPSYGEAIVEETWFDYGGGMKWTTIIMRTHEGACGDYQMLNPFEQGQIMYGDLEDVCEAVKDVIESHLKLQKYKTDIRRLME